MEDDEWCETCETYPLEEARDLELMSVDETVEDFLDEDLIDLDDEYDDGLEDEPPRTKMRRDD